MTVDLTQEYVEQLADNLPRCLPDAPAPYAAAATLRALAAENARLRAENATTYQRGAEAMREAAADAFGHDMTGKLLAASIRALPIPDQPKEGA